VLVGSIGAHRSGDRGLAARERVGLVEHDGVDAPTRRPAAR
jgi:hypothetical protein